MENPKTKTTKVNPRTDLVSESLPGYHRDSFAEFLTQRHVLLAIAVRVLMATFVDLEWITRWWILMKTKYHD